jgi:tripartite-type tricarboxylate transporter receptor subunit TctC
LIVVVQGREGQLRRILSAAMLALVLSTASATAQQGYPSRPIRLLAGYPPGGAVDIIARVYGQALSVRLGQPVVIENKPGIGGNLASDMAAKAAPDGYTLLHGTENVFVSNPHVYGSRMPFDPFKDLVPVASLVSNQIVLTVNPASQATTLQEFVELARRTKPPLFYGSIGNGSQHHLAMEMLKQHVGIDLTHVPYRGGGPAAIALLTGEVSAMFGGGSVVPTIKSGKLRGLASTGTVRNPATPELPTIAEIYPGFEALSWHALFVPAGTPQPIIDRLRAEIAAVLAQPEFRERLASTGSGEPYVVSPEEFAERMKRDYEKYGKLIRSIGVKVE